MKTAEGSVTLNMSDVNAINNTDFGYKSGDIITIVDDLAFHAGISPGINEDMKKSCSKSYKIIERLIKNPFCYRLEGVSHSWSSAMFQESYGDVSEYTFDREEFLALL